MKLYYEEIMRVIMYISLSIPEVNSLYDENDYFDLDGIPFIPFNFKKVLMKEVVASNNFFSSATTSFDGNLDNPDITFDITTQFEKYESNSPLLRRKQPSSKYQTNFINTPLTVSYKSMNESMKRELTRNGNYSAQSEMIRDDAENSKLQALTTKKELNFTPDLSSVNSTNLSNGTDSNVDINWPETIKNKYMNFELGAFSKFFDSLLSMLSYINPNLLNFLELNIRNVQLNNKVKINTPGNHCEITSDETAYTRNMRTVLCDCEYCVTGKPDTALLIVSGKKLKSNVTFHRLRTQLKHLSESHSNPQPTTIRYEMNTVHDHHLKQPTIHFPHVSASLRKLISGNSSHTSFEQNSRSISTFKELKDRVFTFTTTGDNVSNRKSGKNTNINDNYKTHYFLKLFTVTDFINSTLHKPNLSEYSDYLIDYKTEWKTPFSFRNYTMVTPVTAMKLTEYDQNTEYFTSNNINVTDSNDKMFDPVLKYTNLTMEEQLKKEIDDISSQTINENSIAYKDAILRNNNLEIMQLLKSTDNRYSDTGKGGNRVTASIEESIGTQFEYGKGEKCNNFTNLYNFIKLVDKINLENQMNIREDRNEQNKKWSFTPIFQHSNYSEKITYKSIVPPIYSAEQSLTFKKAGKNKECSTSLDKGRTTKIIFFIRENTTSNNELINCNFEHIDPMLSGANGLHPIEETSENIWTTQQLIYNNNCKKNIKSTTSSRISNSVERNGYIYSSKETEHVDFKPPVFGETRSVSTTNCEEDYFDITLETEDNKESTKKNNLIGVKLYKKTRIKKKNRSGKNMFTNSKYDKNAIVSYITKSISNKIGNQATIKIPQQTKEKKDIGDCKFENYYSKLILKPKRYHNAEENYKNEQFTKSHKASSFMNDWGKENSKGVESTIFRINSLKQQYVTPGVPTTIFNFNQKEKLNYKLDLENMIGEAKFDEKIMRS